MREEEKEEVMVKGIPHFTLSRRKRENPRNNNTDEENKRFSFGKKGFSKA